MKIRKASRNFSSCIRLALCAAVASFLLAAAIPHASGQAGQRVDPKHDHPAPGTRIIHFQKIDAGVYKGSEPKNDADYRFLRSQHIKYIVEIKFWPVLDRLEIHKARKYGMVVIPVTVNGSVVSPSEKHIRHVLCLLSDKRLRPVYFHCTLGRDRTALIATLYEIYFMGLPPEKARAEMDRFGFKEGWTLTGLSKYLQKHASSPWDNSKDSCQHLPLPSSDKETK
jgi:hypothetical protein